jgi:lysozyme
MATMINRDAPGAGLASLQAMKGRYGDTELVHMSKPEVRGLQSLGKLTVNPDTGLPEAFGMSDMLPIILGIVGGAVGGPLGAGLGSGIGSYATGSSLKESALKGGMSAIGSWGMGQIMSGVGAESLGETMINNDVMTAGLGAIDPSLGPVLPMGEIGAEAAKEGLSQTASGTAGLTVPGVTAGTGTGIEAAGYDAGSFMAQGGSELPASIASPGAAPAMPNSFGGSTMGLQQGIQPLATDPGFGVSPPTDPQAWAMAPNADYTAGGAPAKLTQGVSEPSGLESWWSDVRTDHPEWAKGFDERVGKTSTYATPILGGIYDAAMEPEEYAELEEQPGSTYVPNERKLEGGVQTSPQDQESILASMLAGGGGYNPLSEQYRYAAEGGPISPQKKTIEPTEVEQNVQADQEDTTADPVTAYYEIVRNEEFDPNHFNKKTHYDKETQSYVVYKDPAKNKNLLSVGPGVLVDKELRRKYGKLKKGTKIPAAEIDQIAMDRWNKAYTSALKMTKGDEEASLVVAEMVYQMGATKTLGFGETLKLIRQGKYEAAGKEALNSDWAKQTPARAKRVASRLASVGSGELNIRAVENTKPVSKDTFIMTADASKKAPGLQDVLTEVRQAKGVDEIPHDTIRGPIEGAGTGKSDSIPKKVADSGPEDPDGALLSRTEQAIDPVTVAAAGGGEALEQLMANLEATTDPVTDQYLRDFFSKRV